jgi:hypothetical protein
MLTNLTSTDLRTTEQTPDTDLRKRALEHADSSYSFLYRQIVSSGEVPSAETLTALDLMLASCNAYTDKEAFGIPSTEIPASESEAYYIDADHQPVAFIMRTT